MISELKINIDDETNPEVITYFSPKAESGINDSVAILSVTGGDKERYLKIEKFDNNSTFLLSLNIDQARAELPQSK